MKTVYREVKVLSLNYSWVKQSVLFNLLALIFHLPKFSQKEKDRARNSDNYLTVHQKFMAPHP